MYFIGSSHIVAMHGPETIGDKNDLLASSILPAEALPRGRVIRAGNKPYMVIKGNMLYKLCFL